MRKEKECMTFALIKTVLKTRACEENNPREIRSHMLFREAENVPQRGCGCGLSFLLFSFHEICYCNFLRSEVLGAVLCIFREEVCAIRTRKASGNQTKFCQKHRNSQVRLEFNTKQYVLWLCT